MNKPLHWLSATLLATMAGLATADDLGITMSIMADDEQDLTGSISRQIELSEPLSQQPRTGNRLRLLQEMRSHLSTEQRQEFFAGQDFSETLSSSDLQQIIQALDNQQLSDMVNELSHDSLTSLLESLDTSRANQLIEDMTDEEQQQLLDNLLESGDDEPALDDETDEPLLPLPDDLLN